MNCPVCKLDAFVSEQMGEGLTTLRCERCEGHWIPSFVYWKWTIRRGINVPEAASRGAGAARKAEPAGAKLCPECGQLLVKHRVKSDVPFTVDRCGNCAGIWLDQGEWDALKERNLHDDLDYIFTSAWQRRVRKEDAAAAGEAALKKALGPDDFAEARRVRAWLSRHPKRDRILPYVVAAPD